MHVSRLHAFKRGAPVWGAFGPRPSSSRVQLDLAFAFDFDFGGWPAQVAATLDGLWPILLATLGSSRRGLNDGPSTKACLDCAALHTPCAKAEPAYGLFGHSGI